MGTHDEVTRAYFSSSDVRCELVHRSGGKGNRLTDGTVAGAFFSHHQKSIVCDAPPLAGAPVPYRRLVAFVGGLDLTLGVLLVELPGECDVMMGWFLYMPYLSSVATLCPTCMYIPNVAGDFAGEGLWICCQCPDNLFRGGGVGTSPISKSVGDMHLAQCLIQFVV